MLYTPLWLMVVVGVLAAWLLKVPDRVSPSHDAMPSAWRDIQEAASYDVVYRTWERGVGDLEERILVRRPYWSHITSRRLNDGKLIFETITNASGYFIHNFERNNYLKDETAARWSAFDYRPLSVIDLLEPRGLLEVLGLGSHQGEDCLRLRLGSASGELLSPPTEGDWNEICVGRSGVILREKWVVGHNQLRLREARSVKLGVLPSLKEFDVTGEIVRSENPLEDSVIKDDPNLGALTLRGGFVSNQGSSRVIEGGTSLTVYRFRSAADQVLEVVSLGEQGSVDGLARSWRLKLKEGKEVPVRVALWGTELALEQGKRYYIVRGPDPETVIAAARVLVERS
ncbi:MAG: hypothetical protein AB1679_19335 [Actinomycetota bacterium]